MIRLRNGILPHSDGEIRCYLPDESFTISDRKEFVANAKYEALARERPKQMLIFDDVLFKSDFIRTFLILKSRLSLAGDEKILELGASHGWASVILKKEFPKSYVVASDLVPDTLKHAAGWEQLLGCEMDEKWAFNTRAMPFESEQFDRIFTFASFHHFGENGNFARALSEMIRVLAPNGKIVLLYEPSSPGYFYPFAFNRVNRNRKHEGVDEDVVVVSQLQKLAVSLGAQCTCEFFPDYQYRSSLFAALYYFLLSRIGKARKLFVCTVNITIEMQATNQSPLTGDEPIRESI